MSKLSKTDIHKNAMVEAMEKSLGIVTTACKAVGISRETHYSWMREDPQYKAAIENLSNVAIDFAESQLHKRMKEGSDAAIIFFLKCRGKSRGYIERQEMDHSGEIKISVKEELMS